MAQYKKHEININNGVKDYRLSIGSGNYLYLHSAPDNANVQVRLSEYANDPIPMIAKTKIKAKNIDKVFIEANAVDNGFLVFFSAPTMDDFDYIPPTLDKEGSIIVERIESIADNVYEGIETAIDNALAPFDVEASGNIHMLSNYTRGFSISAINNITQAINAATGGGGGTPAGTITTGVTNALNPVIIESGGDKRIKTQLINMAETLKNDLSQKIATAVKTELDLANVIENATKAALTADTTAIKSTPANIKNTYFWVRNAEVRTGNWWTFISADGMGQTFPITPTKTTILKACLLPKRTGEGGEWVIPITYKEGACIEVGIGREVFFVSSENHIFEKTIPFGTNYQPPITIRICVPPNTNSWEVSYIAELWEID